MAATDDKSYLLLNAAEPAITAPQLHSSRSFAEVWLVILDGWAGVTNVGDLGSI